MPTVVENLQLWNSRYDWRDAGDEWSAQFGGTEALWWFVLYPRIHRFLPAGTILEIAPGFGRWTQFLRHQCETMIALDISEKCIEHCKKRFEADTHAQFYVNDGSSLAAVPDASIDFVFIFDSLVHAENEVIRSYLLQLASKLTPNGVGFIHHSNMASYPGRLAFVNYYRRLPSAFRRYVLKEKYMERLLSINVTSWRATSVSAKLFRKYCEQADLKCVSQELINWDKGDCLIDTLSIFTKPNSQWDRKDLHLENDQFVKATALTRRLSGLYCR